MSELATARPDFVNKTVTLYLMHYPAECAVTLDSPVFQDQAGRLFVVGQVVGSGDEDWAAGIPMSVAWDQVSQYLVFDSIEQYQHRIDAHPKSGFFSKFSWQ